jgi:hypothetical protein
MAPVTMADLLADSHAAKYADVYNDSSFGPAVKAALEEMSLPATSARMRDVVDRYDLPPLAAALREIESRPEVVAACKGRPRSALRRFKQAVGTACKVVMAKHHDYAPKDLASGSPDQARVEDYCEWFTTARRYRQR